MREVAVNIGTNLGNRRENLRFALNKIAEFAGTLRTSKIYETEAWGYTSCNPFYNIGAVFKSDLSAEDLYDKLHQIELLSGCQTHRDGSGNYIDRLLDIDIIYVGNEVIDGELSIPHPRLYQRSFVILPLAELTPEWVDSRTNMRISDFLEGLDKSDVIGEYDL